MKYERSCGAVIFFTDKSCPKHFKYLLLQHRKSRHWGFPKGHTENGETDMETAIREIKEETGLTVNFINGFRQTSNYSPRPNVAKTVIYFLAQAESEDIVVPPEEISRYRWGNIDLSVKTLRHFRDRSILKKAHEFLTGMPDKNQKQKKYNKHSQRKYKSNFKEPSQ